MDGSRLREARRERGWTQVELARHLGVSQTYVSLLESGQRTVPRHVAAKLVTNLALPPTAVPMTDQTAPWSADTAARALGSLGYAGFAHLKRARAVNPAELLFRTLSTPNVEARLVEALPWVLVQYPDLDWDWLVARAKLNDLQNRLGFVVTLGRELAERQSNRLAAQVLSTWEQRLAYSRLQREDTFANDTMTASERQWLKTHRSAEAAQWNLLSNMSVEALTSA
jgi:transcriptional regulator with XRE-family HTH domain